ncbi:MAG: hypothetical protein ACRES5_05760 [Pseudomonas sp.]|uniref:hypothetical protein n=1 Tax=Stenotrophomonas sp. TaxID=69392 RepID=UPI003D6D40C3
MAKRQETSEQLRERILAAMRADIGISERMAQPFVESVMQCFAGEQPYFPALAKVYPVDAIRAALKDGIPVKHVMRQFNVSRSKLHELFPGGLPKPGESERSRASMKAATN